MTSLRVLSLQVYPAANNALLPADPYNDPRWDNALDRLQWPEELADMPMCHQDYHDDTWLFADLVDDRDQCFGREDAAIIQRELLVTSTYWSQYLFYVVWINDDDDDMWHEIYLHGRVARETGEFRPDFTPIDRLSLPFITAEQRITAIEEDMAKMQPYLLGLPWRQTFLGPYNELKAKLEQLKQMAPDSLVEEQPRWEESTSTLPAVRAAGK